MFKFRRATHDRDGKYLFGEQTYFQKLVWSAHGDIVHHLSCAKSMSYEELLREIRSDVTNYDYGPADLKEWRDGGPLPTPEQVALGLVRCIEAGFVEVTNSD